MSAHRVTVAWKNNGKDFSYHAYDRSHTWTFEGGINVEASGAPEFLGNPSYANPEEAYVASLSSCHMLTFLSIASRKRLVVVSYSDKAAGFLTKNDKGRLAITRVELNPVILFTGDQPSQETIDYIHELSHKECFIANSVLTEVIVKK